MAYFPPTGSVVAFQSDPTKLVGTVSVVGNMNSSVTAFQGGTWSTSVVGGISILGGTVGAIQSGAWTTSVVGGVSILGGTVSTNQIQISGVAISADAGNTNTGTQRIVQATASSFNTSVLTVGTTITSIIAANTNRIKITLVNNGTNPIYVGSSGLLTTGTGQFMAGIAGYPIVIRSSASIFGIASVAQSISYLEEIK